MSRNVSDAMKPEESRFIFQFHDDIRSATNLQYACNSQLEVTQYREGVRCSVAVRWTLFQIQSHPRCSNEWGAEILQKHLGGGQFGRYIYYSNHLTPFHHVQWPQFPRPTYRILYAHPSGDSYIVDAIQRTDNHISRSFHSKHRDARQSIGLGIT